MKIKSEGKTIKQRLLKFTLSTMAVAVIGLIILLGGVSVGFIINLTKNLQSSQVSAVEENISGWYSGRIAELEMIRDTIENYDMTNVAEYDIASYLAYMLNQNASKGIYDYYVGMEDTSCYFGGGWEPAPGEYDPTSRDWYKSAIGSDGVYVSEAYVDAETGRVVITISTAIKKDGQAIGVLAADIFTDDIQKIADETFDKKSSKYVILVDKAGTVIAHKNNEYNPTADAEGNEILTSYKDAKIPDNVVNNNELSTAVGSDYKGLFRIYTGKYIDFAEISIAVVDTGLHYYGGVVIFIILCIILLITILLLCKHYTAKYLYPLLTPLNELKDMASEVSQGHLSYTASYARNDEIGTVCRAIEESNKSVQSYIDDIAEKLEKISNGDLTESIEAEYIGDFVQLKDSINKIIESLNNTMQLILQATEDIRQSTSDVRESATDLSKNVTGVENRLSTALDAITEVKDKFNENLTQTNDSITISNSTKEAIDDTKISIDELTDAMEKITEKSNDIAHIIDMINDIANQTNILSLNASIEAARAGDAGQGFAVVAANVRDLANQTSNAVARSSALINETLSAIEQGNLIAEKASGEMDIIVEKTNQVNDHIAQIAGSIQEESVIVENLTDTISSIGDFVQETENTSKECVDKTIGLYEEVDNMHEIIDAFKLAKE